MAEPRDQRAAAREKRADELGRYFIGECGCRCPIELDGRVERCECEPVRSGTWLPGL